MDVAVLDDARAGCLSQQFIGIDQRLAASVLASSQCAHIRYHHEVMARFGAGVTGQRAREFGKPDSAAAFSRTADPALHGFRHLRPEGAEMHQERLQENLVLTWLDR